MEGKEEKSNLYIGIAFSMTSFGDWCPTFSLARLILGYLFSLLFLTIKYD